MNRNRAWSKKTHVSFHYCVFLPFCRNKIIMFSGDQHYFLFCFCSWLLSMIKSIISCVRCIITLGISFFSRDKTSKLMPFMTICDRHSRKQLLIIIKKIKTWLMFARLIRQNSLSIQVIKK